MSLSVAHHAAQALSLLFALLAAAHLLALPALAGLYRRWGYARGFHYVAGTLQALTALFLWVEQTRIWGGILAAAILFFTVVALLNRRHYFYAVPVMLAMVALAPAMIGTL
ncbi:MAG: hypothetical protein H6924_09215 [Alphaproteobacteria bacterium]|nr:hypothetical protein [Alphaproteobacteria bacterium]